LPVKLMFFRIRENSLTASQENPAKLYDERCSTCALKFLYIKPISTSRGDSPRMAMASTHQAGIPCCLL
ncbi:MAG: hypothetical protein ACR2PX_17695, partial [Endozoicomonas sp.]